MLIYKKIAPKTLTASAVKHCTSNYIKVVILIGLVMHMRIHENTASSNYANQTDIKKLLA